MSLTIRPARPGEEQALSALCLRSKAHWGYDADFMAQCVEALTVTPESVAAGAVLVAERDGRLLGIVCAEPGEGGGSDEWELALCFVEPEAMGQGVGKALFADLAAQRVLAEAAQPEGLGEGLIVPETHPTAHLIDAGSHPDLRRLSRLPRDRKPDELARNITVDQIRGIQSLFATTPSMSDWRAVVIDAIDALERPAANALLKNLEEPPAKCVFLLVCHSPGRILPTIRSPRT